MSSALENISFFHSFFLSRIESLRPYLSFYPRRISSYRSVTHLFEMKNQISPRVIVPDFNLDINSISVCFSTTILPKLARHGLTISLACFLYLKASTLLPSSGLKWYCWPLTQLYIQSYLYYIPVNYIWRYVS